MKTDRHSELVTVDIRPAARTNISDFISCAVVVEHVANNEVPRKMIDALREFIFSFILNMS